jgi:hypothetical protein
MKTKLCLIFAGLVFGLSSTSCPVFAYSNPVSQSTAAKSVLEEQETTVLSSIVRSVSSTETTMHTTAEATTKITTTETTTETTSAQTTTAETTTETTSAQTTSAETTTEPVTELSTETTDNSVSEVTTEVTSISTDEIFTEVSTETTTSITVEYILNNYSRAGIFSPSIVSYGTLYLSSYIPDSSSYNWIMDDNASKYYNLSSDGVVTFVARGSGYVYAYNTTENKYYRFEVKPKSSSSDDFTEINNSATIYIKTSQTKDLYSYVEKDLIASAYTWKTDDDDVCSVTSKGIIKGVDKGDTYVRCYYYDSTRSYSYKFHVYVEKSTTYSSKGTSSSKSSTVVTVSDEKTETTTKTASKTSSKTSISEKTTVTADYKTKALDKFNDISHREWAIDAIGSMVDKGYIVGVSDTSFLPDNFCTRADFSIVLAKMLNLSDSNTSAPYDDVSSSDYFYTYVNAVKSVSADAGVTDNKFRPRDYITREEAFTMVYEALTAKGWEFDTSDAVLNNYADSYEISSSQYKTAISALLNNKLITGTDTGIAPSATITRAQMAVLLNNIYNNTTM